MTWLWLVVAVGPVVDPETGTTLTAGDRELLPSARSLPSIADLWLADVVSLQPATDMGQFDAPYTAVHGRSFTQVRWFLNDVDFSDPARAGRPLLVVPFAAWDTLAHESLFTSAPGFRYRLVPHPQGLAARFGSGGNLGGGTWVPRGLMDREPASLHGAPSERRALTSPLEVTGDGSTGDFRFVAERLQHRHHYLTLGPSDFAERTTVLGLGQTGPVQALLAWQGESRSHAGAELRLPEALTIDAGASAALVQLGTDLTLHDDTQLRLRFGGGWRQDHEHDQGPLVTDLEDEWLWLGRARAPEKLSRQRLDASAELLADEVQVLARMSYATLGARTHTGSRSGITYDGEPAGPGPTQGLYVTDWAPSGRAEESLTSARADATWRGQVEDARVVLTGGLDLGRAGTPGGPNVEHLSPAAGALARYPVGAGEVFLLVRREPEHLTSEVAEAIDPARPSGITYAWNDDGDLVPEPGEEGALTGRTGGLFHDVDPHLHRPASQQLAIGGTTGRLGPFRLHGMLVGRWLTNRYELVYDEATQQSFEAVTVHDPGGDGRGEIRAEEGGQDLTGYAGSSAGARYVLTNAAETDYYLGLELQLFTVETAWWFLNLGGSAYLSRGGAPFGSFADRNDPGVIDEASADPNHRFRERGRYDHDRSFGLNLLAGVMPLEGALVSTTVRYRDGEPFMRPYIAEDLPQGPVALMAVRRGKPRHTFHMEVLLRAAYRLELEDYDAGLAVDLINVLGSGTELLEDPRTGPTYREPLEMVPGRAVFVTLSVGH